MNIINEDESLEDLQCKGLKLIQKKKGFRFGIDAVLLANFADVPENSNVLDLGTGTGIIPILIWAKSKASKIIGIEIQPQLVEMAVRSIMLNGITDKVQILHSDIKKLDFIPKASYDVILSNPPYVKENSGIRNADSAKDISRHEVLCNLEDVVKNASRLLRVGGQFAMVHKPERLVDILCLMRQYKIEPKYLRFVHPHPYKKPNILLIKGVRGGREDLKVLEPLYVYDQNGKYSDDINEIYGRGERTV